MDKTNKEVKKAIDQAKSDKLVVDAKNTEHDKKIANLETNEASMLKTLTKVSGDVLTMQASQGTFGIELDTFKTTLKAATDGLAALTKRVVVLEG